MHDSEAIVEDVLSAGARGCLLKAGAGNHLSAAVQALGRHEAYISGKVSASLLDTLLTRRKAKPRDVLAPRERAVVQLIAEGNTNKSACARLGVSLKTVETHCAAVPEYSRCDLGIFPDCPPPAVDVHVADRKRVALLLEEYGPWLNWWWSGSTTRRMRIAS